MKKNLRFLLCLTQIISYLWFTPVFPQKKDTIFHTGIKTQLTQPNSKQPYKPEILTSGFFDIVNNGQVNASARFIRLFIGEPGKFALPLSIYSGVSSNNFQTSKARVSTAAMTNWSPTSSIRSAAWPIFQ